MSTRSILFDMEDDIRAVHDLLSYAVPLIVQTPIGEAPDPALTRVLTIATELSKKNLAAWEEAFEAAK